MFLPIDYARALTPEAIEFVADGAADSLAFQRLRALNAARASCAHAAAHADADVGRRKYERYVDVITEAEGALEALDRGEGPTARPPPP